jgi:Putative auto-transporter adhesin, head GIN domain
MKSFICCFTLILLLANNLQSQSSYSYYNGKKWEQISGNGKLVQLQPAVTGFSSVHLSHMNARVVIETGAPNYSLQVSIDENLKDFFRYQQSGNTLQLSFDLSGGKYDRWLSNNNTVVTIKVPQLESLHNNGNSNIELLNLDQQAFKLMSSGNADIRLAGKVNEALIQTTGNSDIDGSALISVSTTLSSSGNADIVLNTKELIETNMNGNNEVRNMFGDAPASPATNSARPGLEMIKFKLRNNSMMPTKLSVISYRPDENGNGTNAFYLLPYGTRSFTFPVDTKIFLATQNQVNTVMSGASIVQQVPFLVVKKENNHKTININP